MAQPINKELGQSGTFMTQGFLALQDYNTELTGPLRIAIYDKMRKSDATVRISVMALVLPILAANWGFEPASDDPTDVEIADFLTKALLDKDSPVSWRSFCMESLKLMLSYGNMVFEKVYGFVDYEGTRYIGFSKLGPRHPQTILRWRIGPNTDQMGVQQQLHTGETIEIPWQKLIVFVNEQEGDNYEGISLLRSSYLHWDIKQKLYKIEAIKFERQGLGIPMAKVKPDMTPSDKEIKMVEKALENLRANEKARVIVPASFDIEWMDMKANTTAELKDSIAHHDRQISKNAFAQFLEIGGSKGSSGSLSASDNQMDVLMLALGAIANYFRETFQRMAVKDLVDINYPGHNKYPELKVDKIGPDNATKIAAVVQQGVSAGVLTISDEDEEWMRQLIDMPDMAEEFMGRDRHASPIADPNSPADPADGADEPDPQDPNEKKEAPETNAAVTDLLKEVRHALYDLR